MFTFMMNLLKNQGKGVNLLKLPFSKGVGDFSPKFFLFFLFNFILLYPSR